MHEYKITEKAEDPRDSVIEKNNITSTFTIREIEASELANEKVLREWKAMAELNAAKCKNIEEHHPFVKEMKEEDLFTCHMYQEAMAFVRSLKPKIEEFEKTIAESKLERQEIYKQTGVFIEEAAPMPVPQPKKPHEEKEIDTNKKD